MAGAYTISRDTNSLTYAVPKEGSDDNFKAVLPTDPPDLVVDYALTTFYHWPQFSVNLTERNIVLDDTMYGTMNGPTLFKYADVLNVGGNENQVNLSHLEQSQDVV